MSEWSGQAYGIGREVLDVAPKGVAGVSGVDTLGRFHERAHVGPDAMGSEVSERQQDSPDSQTLEVVSQGNGRQLSIGPLCVDDSGGGNGVQRDSATGQNGPIETPVDRFGDDRFADNILRALEGLPQNGDAEEEEAAAEEGALIEASGMPDPAHDPRFA